MMPWWYVLILSGAFLLLLWAVVRSHNSYLQMKADDESSFFLNGKFYRIVNENKYIDMKMELRKVREVTDD